MKILDLLNKLKEKNIFVEVIHGELDIVVKDDNLTDELLDDIRTNKEDIIKYFSNKGKVRTPSDFTFKGMKLKEYKSLLESTHISDSEVEDIYNLTSLQEGFLFHGLMDNKSSAYFEQISFDLSGDININSFKKSWEIIISRHDVFRSMFISDFREPIQIVLKDREIDFEFSDFSFENYFDVKLAELKKRDRERSFNFERDKLFRINLIKKSNKEYTLVISFHHIIMDGWCVPIIMSELFNIYSALLEDGLLELGIPGKYSDYIKWINNRDTYTDLEFWNDYLNSYEELATIPKDTNSNSKGNLPLSYSFLINKSDSESITKLSGKLGVTLSTLIQSLWGVILGIYNRTDDVVFGSTISGRPQDIEGVEKIVGLFINTIPVRIKQAGINKFSELVKSVARDSIKCLNYHHSSLAEIQSESNLKDGLFDHIIVFENYPINDVINGNAGIEIEDIDYFEQVNYDFFISVFPGETIEFKLNYNPNKFSEDRIRRIAGHINCLISLVIKNPDLDISNLDILPDNEKLEINKFGTLAFDSVTNKTVIEVFEKKVKECPDKLAVVYKDIKLTYGELNRKANILGNYLRKQYNIKADDLIGVTIDRSEKMIIALLGIMKSGAAYVPIDPKHPKDRISYVINDAKPKVVLDEEVIISILAENNNDKNPVNIISPDNLAYVIYTSGSTGRPKGVLIEHNGVCNILSYLENKYPLETKDRFLLKTNYTFDVSVTELFGWFFGDGELVILEKGLEKEPYSLVKYINEKNITHINFAPSMFNEFLSCIDENKSYMNSLKYIFVAGEAFNTGLVEKLDVLDKSIYVENIYGPTEATIYASGFSVNRSKKYNSVPIGKPVGNITLRIVDENNNIVPIGVPGELCISGVGLARGYLNNKELTKEKFVNNSCKSNEVMYKTGDLVAWLPDGNIEFFGRLDNQVKIRGFRIELGEIECLLTKYYGIKNSTVTIYEDKNSDKSIIAYYEADSTIEKSKIRSFLSESLPYYMIPSHFIQLDKIPVNSSGKVDKKNLPSPDKLQTIKKEFQGPENDTQRKLCDIWQYVLGIEKVGINDNFFELGGHSLKATRMISKIYRELEVKLEIKSIFENPTIKEIAKHIEGLAKTIFSEIKVLEEKKYYDLSSSQRRLWLLEQFEGTGSVYNMPASFILEGTLDLDAFRKAYNYLINRHESLRTVFITIDGEPKQKILENPDFSINLIDLIGKESANEVIQKISSDNTNMSFNLEEGPLVRFTVVKLNKNKNLLLFNMHHIISDGWSMNIFSKEFFEAYNRYIDGNEPNFKPLRIQYKDYSSWQNKLFESESILEQKKYWLDKMSGEIPVLDIPSDNPRPKNQTFNGSTIDFCISSKLTAGLNSLCRNEGVSLFMLLQAVVKTLLFRYTGSEDIIVGSPIAGRVHQDLENQIGLYLNTLALRDNICGDFEFDKFLKDVKKTCSDAFENQDYPFDRLVEDLELNRDLSRSPLFDVLVALQNNETTEFSLDGLDISSCNTKRSISKFDITYEFTEVDDEIQCNIEFNSDIYNRDRISRMGEHLKLLITSIIENPKNKIKDLNIISDSEKDLLLNKFNDTKSDYPKDKTIIDIFEQQVEKTPNNIAIVFEDVELTYSELNQKANIVGNYLRKNYYIKPDDFVGVMLDRSEKMIIALLGILKSGAAYVPIDPGYPEDRVSYMLEDSSPKVVLSENNDFLDINTVLKSGSSTENPDRIASSNNLAYVIYTSGSTGKPKGTLIEHRSVCCLTKNTNYIDVNSSDVILQLSNYAFDGSVFDIYGSLLNGAKLIIIKKEYVTTIDKLTNVIENNQVSIFFITTALFNVLVDTGLNSLKHVKKILFGGEKCSPIHIKKAFNFLGPNKLVHMYGPTECTVYTTFFNIDKVFKNEDQTYPIGSARSNLLVYVLDSNNKVVPLGVPGELCISGEGLSRGYLNRPKLTSEKFVDNPFVTGDKMYRTGDLVRWLNDGNVEFIGRIDNQVKIRGFRIELGEIESSLSKFEEISSSVVIAKEGDRGSKYLTAYYCSDIELVASEIRSKLCISLPDYMIPSYFIRLDEIPLTPNGKVDRKKLPDPVISEIALSSNYYPPETKNQEFLVEIWKGILNSTEKIGIDDNFFELGGDSIKAIQIVSRLSQEGYKGEVSALFHNPTIRGFAEYLKKDSNSADQSLVTGEVSLSPIQKWFFTKFEYTKNHYNQSIILKIEDELNDTKISILKKCAESLLIHHDSLRMSYVYKGDAITQINRPEVNLDFYEYDLTDNTNPGDKIEDISNGIQSSFNIEKDTLIKFALFKLLDGYRLLVVAHHLVIDGVSWRILVEDLENGYNQLLKKDEITFPRKTTSYKQWSKKLVEISLSKEINEERNYWLDVSSKYLQSISDFNEYTGKKISEFSLSTNETELLLTRCHKAFNTQVNDILLTALSRAISKWSGNDSILIGLESHGRSDNLNGIDLTRTIGWFTSLFPVVFEDINSNEISEDIINVKETLREVPNNGMGYGILKFLSENIEPKFNNDPSIVFNYLGQFDNGSDSGLFQISNESSGNNIPLTVRSPYKLCFNGMVSKGKLRMVLDSEIFDQKTLDNIQKLFLEELQIILTYTDDFIQLAEDFKTTSNPSENIENEEIYI